MTTEKNQRCPWVALLLLIAFVLFTLGCMSIKSDVGSVQPPPAPAAVAKATAFAQSQSPGRPVPEDRWGALRPVLYANCSELRISKPCMMGDVTRLNPLEEPGDRPFYHDLAVGGDYIFTATGQGMRIFKVTDPRRPSPFRYVDASEQVSKRTQGTAAGGQWTFTDKNFFLSSISVPGENHNIVATGNEEFGFIAWDTTDKGAVTYRYQDAEPFVRDAYAAPISGREYAITLDNAATLRVYDLTAIAGLSKCYEQDDSCPGAFVRELARGKGIGGAIAGQGNFVAYRNHLRVQILDFRDVRTTNVRLDAALSGFTHVGELAIWQDGGSYFLALAAGVGGDGKTLVYDVGCITGPGRCSLPAPMVYDTPAGAGNALSLTVDFSRSSDGTPYLFVGSTQTGTVCAPQRSYLFDASDPFALVDLTPRVHPDGYWSWYDEACVGYNRTAPRHAVVQGTTLYRAGYSILDSHSIGGPRPIEPPVAPESIFSDGFETGDVSAWSGSVGAI